MDKSKPYIVGTKVFVFTNYAAICYLFAKKDAKLQLIGWALLFKKFNLEIQDKKGSENVVAKHLSRIKTVGAPIKDLI